MFWQHLHFVFQLIKSFDSPCLLKFAYISHKTTHLDDLKCPKIAIAFVCRSSDNGWRNVLLADMADNEVKLKKMCWSISYILSCGHFLACVHIVKQTAWYSSAEKRRVFFVIIINASVTFAKGIIQFIRLRFSVQFSGFIGGSMISFGNRTGQFLHRPCWDHTETTVIV